MMRETFLSRGDILIVNLPAGKIIIKATAKHRSKPKDKVDIYPKNGDKKTFYLKEKNE